MGVLVPTVGPILKRNVDESMWIMDAKCLVYICCQAKREC